MRPPFGVFKVSQLDVGLEGIHVGRVRLATNTAVYFYRLGSVLIDSGSANQWHKVQQYVRSRSPPSAVVVSHHHEDHAGNVFRLHREFNAATGSTVPATPVYAPQASLYDLNHGFDIEWYRQLIWGKIKPDPAAGLLPLPKAVPSTMPDGSTVTIIPVSAPGHCPDHTVFYVPERQWLFSADLFVTSTPKMAFYGEEPLTSISTLRKICYGMPPTTPAATTPGAESNPPPPPTLSTSSSLDSDTLTFPLDVSSMFCAHRGKLTDGAARLRARLQWLEDVQGACESLLASGIVDVGAITRAVLGGKEDALYYTSRGDFSRRNLVIGLLKGKLPSST